jgi:hypothetical protein
MIKDALEEKARQDEAEAERKKKEAEGQFEDLYKTAEQSRKDLQARVDNELQPALDAAQKEIKKLQGQLADTFKSRLEALPAEVVATKPDEKAPNYLDLLAAWLPGAEALAAKLAGNAPAPPVPPRGNPPAPRPAPPSVDGVDKTASVKSRRRTASTF